MGERKIPRVDLPSDVRLDTLAVREGLPPSAWGENSEALFLTSSFRQPDAATAAARFANEEEAFIYSRFTNPTVTMMKISDLLPIEYSWRRISPLGRPRPPRLRRVRPRMMPAIVETYTVHSSMPARTPSTTMLPSISMREVTSFIRSYR